jgi:hypothetical protein
MQPSTHRRFQSSFPPPLFGIIRAFLDVYEVKETLSLVCRYWKRMLDSLLPGARPYSIRLGPAWKPQGKGEHRVMRASHRRTDMYYHLGRMGSRILYMDDTSFFLLDSNLSSLQEKRRNTTVDVRAHRICPHVDKIRQWRWIQRPDRDRLWFLVSNHSHIVQMLISAPLESLSLHGTWTRVSFSSVCSSHTMDVFTPNLSHPYNGRLCNGYGSILGCLNEENELFLASCGMLWKFASPLSFDTFSSQQESPRELRLMETIDLSRVGPQTYPPTYWGTAQSIHCSSACKDRLLFTISNGQTASRFVILDLLNQTATHHSPFRFGALPISAQDCLRTMRIDDIADVKPSITKPLEEYPLHTDSPMVISSVSVESEWTVMTICAPSAVCRNDRRSLIAFVRTDQLFCLKAPSPSIVLPRCKEEFNKITDLVWLHSTQVAAQHLESMCVQTLSIELV